jgi:hypothetical protein
MAHVSITAHGPEGGDGKFGVVQSNADRMPGIRIRRVVREHQRPPFNESTQRRPEAVREVKAKLLGRVIPVRKKR